jgi:hypothetical protein
VIVFRYDVSIETIAVTGSVPISIGHDIELRWATNGGFFGMSNEIHSIQDLRTGVVWDCSVNGAQITHRWKGTVQACTIATREYTNGQSKTTLQVSRHSE